MVSPVRDRLLKVYRHEKVDGIIWQPRIRFWYNGNNVHAKQQDVTLLHDPTIPASFFGLDLLEVHQALDAGIRYPAETLGLPLFSTSINKDAKVRVVAKPGESGEAVIIHETPVGTVIERNKGGYTTEHAVKTPEDMDVVKYIIEHSEFSFNEHAYNLAEDIFEETGLGMSQSYYQRSPFMRCILNYIGFENTALLLKRHRKATEEFIAFMAEHDDAVYDVIERCPLNILNFGENIDCNLTPPRWFKTYCIPYYNKRIKQLHDAGKFCHVHMDGSLRDLLPLIKDTDFDGVEAATPVPQGDVTVEQIKEALGEKILLDGIPATLFMVQFPESALEDTTRRIIELFGQNVILGVSDELPPNGQIARFATVSRLLKGAFKML